MPAEQSLSDSDSDYNPELLLSSSSNKVSEPNSANTNTTTTTNNHNNNNNNNNNTASSSPSSSITRTLPNSLPPIPPSNNAPVKDKKSVKFADSPAHIINEDEHLEQYESSFHSDEDAERELKIVDDNDDSNYGPSESLDPLSNLISPSSCINVNLFNDVVQYFIASPYFNDASFNEKSPSERQFIVLNAYKMDRKLDHDLNPQEVNLNFNATTSYNKQVLKPNEEYQLLIPINPYCRRPDLMTPLSSEEVQKFSKFKADSEKYTKEFECLNFPSGSRLFIGNLAVNSLSLVDVWRVFSNYGEIKAVNMKPGYGFVQFANAEDCQEAIKGETNVPLHNRFMQLQVSKTHEKHTNDNKLKQKEKGRDRDRDRDRSPTRNSASSTKTKVKVIISNESDTGFNHLLVNSLNEVGIESTIKHVENSANEVPQEIISEAAYSGVSAAIVTSKLNLINLFLFQKDTSDNAIRFDEYESISMESGINFILSQIKDKKKERDDDRNNNNRRDGKARDRDSRNKNNNNNNSHNHNHNQNQNHRGNHRDDHRENRRDNHRDRGDKHTSSKTNNSNYNTYNKHQDVSSYARYSPRQQEAQKHLPPKVTPSMNYSPQVMQPQSYSPRPPLPFYQQQQQSPAAIPPPPYYNQYHNQPPVSMQPPINSNPVTSQLVNQLSTLDEGSLKAMLNLVQQQQQPIRPSQQQYYQPPLPVSGQQQPNAATQGVKGLLSRLQTIAPGGPPPPVPVQNFAPPSVPSKPTNSSEEDGTNKLIETLARLKNNM